MSNDILSWALQKGESGQMNRRNMGWVNDKNILQKYGHIKMVSVTVSKQNVTRKNIELCGQMGKAIIQCCCTRKCQQGSWVKHKSQSPESSLRLRHQPSCRPWRYMAIDTEEMSAKRIWRKVRPFCLLADCNDKKRF